ncbi:MAG: helix-turn-helix domain-containing protein [Pseudomonas sp.]|nr:helix-turn-helix domain-containing protein [Pseudomonas sp.]
MTEPTKRRTSRPVLTDLHRLLLKACPPGKDCEGSIRGTLATALGVSYQYVYRWIETNRLPPKFVKPLVEIADGRVTQEELIEFVI